MRVKLQQISVIKRSFTILFLSSIQILYFPGKKLTEEELNALIAHAHRRIEQLQKQIAEQLAMERQRLGAALEAQRQEDLKIANAAVAEERQRLREEFEADKSKLVSDQYSVVVCVATCTVHFSCTLTDI